MLFYLKSKKNNFLAILEVKDNSYILKKGSTVSSTVSSNFKSQNAVSKKRAKYGITQSNLTLKNNIVFKSSTAAGEFVFGHSCNGPELWRNENKVNLKNWLNSLS